MIEPKDNGSLGKISCSSIISQVRLDQFLSSLYPNKSRSYFQNLIKGGFIHINSRLEKPCYKMKLRDLLVIVFPKETLQDIEPIEMRIDIIYEDEDIIVINKPPGQVVHPGAGNLSNTLVHGLLFYTTELSSIGGTERLGIVHRLDKDTSGCMIIAKNDDIHRSLSQAFKEHKIRKRYLALIWGNPSRIEFEIDNKIARSRRNPEKMCIVSDAGRTSKTCFRVLKTYPQFSLIEAKPITGRTHQIRVQLANECFPVIGDSVYGNDATRLKQALPENRQLLNSIMPLISRQMLHSSSITFIHPRKMVDMTFRAVLWSDFAKVLRLANNHLRERE